jgi:hypothetical protein
MALYSDEFMLELFASGSAVVQFSHLVISVSDCFASDVVSVWLSVGISISEFLLFFSLNAVNKSDVVHCQTLFIFVEVIGSMCVIVFALTGTTDGAVIGHIEAATIHVVVNAFLTALFVFSTNFWDLESSFGADSSNFRESN